LLYVEKLKAKAGENASADHVRYDQCDRCAPTKKGVRWALFIHSLLLFSNNDKRGTEIGFKYKNDRGIRIE
jgi:hypothetical protein